MDIGVPVLYHHHAFTREITAEEATNCCRSSL